MGEFDESGLIRLAQQVRTLEEGEPAAYEKLLGALQQITESPSALFFTAFQDSDHVCISNVIHTTGDSVTHELMNRAAGGPYQPSYDIERPPLAQVGRWSVLRDVMKGNLDDEPMYANFYEKPGFTDHLRMLVYENRQFIGWLGVLKRGPFYTRRKRAKLSRWASAAKSVVLEVERVARAESAMDAPCRLMLDANGELQAASADADSWYEPSKRSQLGSFVREFDRGGRGVATIGRTQVSLLRLDGPSGVRYLADCSALKHPRVRASAVLSRRQRQVGELAARGWTVDQISSELEIRPHTVRQHLKSIYARLGVGSRVELRAALAQ